MAILYIDQHCHIKFTLNDTLNDRKSGTIPTLVGKVPTPSRTLTLFCAAVALFLAAFEYLMSIVRLITDPDVGYIIMHYDITLLFIRNKSSISWALNSPDCSNFHFVRAGNCHLYYNLHLIWVSDRRSPRWDAERAIVWEGPRLRISTAITHIIHVTTFLSDVCKVPLDPDERAPLSSCDLWLPTTCTRWLC